MLFSSEQSIDHREEATKTRWMKWEMNSNIQMIFIEVVYCLLTNNVILSCRSQKEQSEWKGHPVISMHKNEIAIFKVYRLISLDKESELHIISFASTFYRKV